MGFIAILATVAIFIGFGPLGGSSPDENASGVKVATYYNAHMAQSWASIYVVGLGLALLTVFFCHLRTVLRDAGEHQALWPNVAFVGGIFLIVGVLVAGVFHVILILAAHNHEYSIAKVVNFADQNNELGMIFGIVILTLGTGASILLNRGAEPLPKRLGWWSVLVGVVTCLGPIGFFGLLFGLPIWAIATGFVVSTKARRSAKAIPTELAGSNLA
jgi:hypothetical protein